MPDIAVEWLRDPVDTDQLAAFFVRNVGTDYISFGEMQCGRAVSAGSWHPGLHDVLRAEFDAILREAAVPGDPSRRLAGMFRHDRMVGLAVVRLEKNALTPFAVLEDMVIDREQRQAGLGARLLSFIESHARTEDCRQIFIESGLENKGAHRFFARSGYAPVATVMAKSLADAPA